MDENNIELENTIENNENKINENHFAEIQENNDILPPSTVKCKINPQCLLKTLLYIILITSVIILYFLHFTTNKKDVDKLSNIIAKSSNTIMLTINNDSIIAHFTLAQLLKTDLETEASKYQQELTSKKSALEEKYKNFQINIKNNVLTQTQIQNAENQLQQEAANFQSLQEQYSYTLAMKEESVHKEITDSIINAANRVNNNKYKADYVLATSTGSAILYANKIYDITDDVIKELNDTYRKTSK